MKRLDKSRVLLGDQRKVADRYLDHGESVSSLMLTFGYSRKVIERFLRRSGIAIRGKGEAARCRALRYEAGTGSDNEGPVTGDLRLSPDVAEGCEEIRRGWSKYTEKKRRVSVPSNYIIPTCKVVASRGKHVED